MPLYEYRCERGHTFEVVQRMSDDPVTSCTICGAPVERVFHPVAVHFKGSGFYTTDYARKGRSRGGASDEAGAGSKSSSESGSGSGEKGSGSAGEKSGSSSGSGSQSGSE
jgi:putative FmdB family regulatory protein